MMASAGENAALPDAPSLSLPLPLTNAGLMITSPAPAFYSAKPSVAGHRRVIDRQFLILSAVSTAAILADSYTTTWIGNNYRSRGAGPCTVEGGEPSLYGLHPAVARTYAIGAAMASGAVAVSYLAKRHLPSTLKWMWPSAFIYETGISVHGFSTNLARC
ncbi:MAG: hypothetical protein ACRD2U_07050 [Terriglobales bacterium]